MIENQNKLENQNKFDQIHKAKPKGKLLLIHFTQIIILTNKVNYTCIPLF